MSSEKKMHIFGSGTVVAVTPLTVAVMGNVNKDKVTTLPVIQGMPFYPGTGLLGALRRALRNVVRDAIIDATGNPKPWDVETYFTMTVGGLGFDKGGEVNIAAADRRALNPLESLFGSVRMKAHLGSGNLYPTDETLREKDAIPIAHGVRSNDFVRDPGELEYLSDEDVVRLNERIQHGSEKSETNADVKGGKQKCAILSKKIKAAQAAGEDAGDLIEALEQQEHLLARQKEEQKAMKEEGKNAIQMPWAGYEFFPAGTTFSHRFSSVSMTMTELGFLLAAFRRFAEMPRLGGHAHHDCGWVNIEWALRTQKGVIGHVVITPDEGFRIQDDRDGLLQSALDAFDEMAGKGFPDCDFVDRESPDLNGDEDGVNSRKKRMALQ